MTTPTKDARAALAEWDASETQHDAVLVVPEIVAALRALIEPVQGDAKLLQNSDREALTRSVGMLLAENDDMEAMDDDAFEIVRDSLVKGLMDLYPAGFRRQVSHPEPVTDEMVEAAAHAFADSRGQGMSLRRKMRAALEAARAAKQS